ncbi:bifunctional glycosyltransferase/CDP-glycerol:glycerophosphate glycerophosphotransferase [Actinomadura flavalba]|uniref:bifunctional glycosyltransferase/CDP-glycerol:glycerophosphate glycerophosphotransferase n=1 Tax=Actinomadura flavalba TaxID=1120938 RepID=UPI0003809D91|nr:CDP-glycerol glycerophosphotransferase family protein [Actinomadura flavalba]
MQPTLSVVVPFYDVAGYIDDCLASLARQTLTDLQVIMVDDGSTDDSVVTAKEYASRDDRFVLVQQDNAGLGPARNTGAAHATGTYLAFADSDDMLLPHAYERMVGTLERTGSDLCTGAVERFDADRVTRASFYGDAFRRARTRTHVSADRALLHDRTAWNKVFRRSFWDEHGFAFPTGAYEDAPVTIPAHVRADAVDVLADPVYRYRVRTGGGPSITQRRTEISNLRDRVASVSAVSAFLRAHAPDLKDEYDRTVLNDDLMLYVNVVEEADDAYRAELCRRIDGYLRGVRPGLLRELPALPRLKYHLACAGRAADLVTVRELERCGLPLAPARPRGLLRRRWYAGLPFRDDPAIPAAVHDVTGELTVRAGIDAVAWTGDRLEITGHAHIAGLPMTADDRIDVWLRHGSSKRRVALPIRRIRTPDAGQPSLPCDHAGFVATVDPAALRRVPKWRSADWRVVVAVRAGRGRSRVRRAATLRRFGPAATWTRARHLADGVRVQVVPADDGRAVVRLRHPRAVATGVSGDAVTGYVRGATGDDDAVTIRCRERDATRTVPVAYGTPDDGRTPFRFVLPDLDGDASVRCDVSLVIAGKAVRIGVGDAFADTVHGPTTVTRTRYGNLVLAQNPRRVLVTGVAWDGGDLVVTGTGVPPAALTLARRRSGHRHTFAAALDGDRFAVRMPLAALPAAEGVLPLFTGTWEIGARDTSGAPLDLTVARDLLTVLPPERTVGPMAYRVRPTRGDEGLHIAAAPAFQPEERGPYGRRVLREHRYPVWRRRPLRDLVLFESYFGWQASCNPRAICDEFRRRDTGHDLVWVRGDRPFPAPPGTRTVQRFSAEYYELTATARLIVNNVAQPPCYRPRDGQRYVQTWHGTPLKKVGFDTDWTRGERRDQRYRELAHDVARWDLLITQNPFSTRELARAFRYDGEILESGYPRNDAAHHPDTRDALRADVRRRLGIPDGKRAVLFAPTWRDHLQTDRHGLAVHHLGLDLERAASALAHDTVLLLRSHHLLNTEPLPSLPGFLVDVSDHPDITALYAASDALITDYSSAMCDFAGLRRPILLYTPDITDYQTSVRGLTLNLTEQAPGPLYTKGDDLIEALTDLDAVATSSKHRLHTFATTYAPHDDGQATTRVVNHLLT